MQSNRETARFTGVVEWVSDGDTIRIQGHEFPIRIWGVDAPERDTAAGQTAREFMTTLVKSKVVECTKVAVDKYRRTVAKCSINGRSLSSLLLENGHGVEMCRFTGGQLGHC